MKMLLDVICPVFWLNERLFYQNFYSWVKELPFNHFLFGINKEAELFDFFFDLIELFGPGPWGQPGEFGASPSLSSRRYI